LSDTKHTFVLRVSLRILLYHALRGSYDWVCTHTIKVQLLPRLN
jgi:hypothetical protein